MTAPDLAPPRPDADNLRATGFMVAGMALFALEDFLIKRVSADMPLPQLLLVLAVGGTLVFAIICRAKGVPLFGPDLRDRLVMGRNISEAIASVAFVSSLALVPLSLASSILQMTPLLVTAGAALWLGETVGWRRWAAVLAGLFGVLVILRPGFAGFEPAALLCVLAAVMLATRDVISRRIPARIPTVQLALWAYCALTVGATILLATSPELSWSTPAAWRDLFLAMAVGVAAYLFLTTATRLGEVSVVIPFRYSRLIFALILGIVFLGERPDAATLIGAAIVVGSGLYALMRERRRKVRVPR